ncbi:MAG TPA: TetR family transcriptional regulator [Acidimicrobiales bacterium]|nr:TetR family transcriptional regulator [Acidimicrobiales bacterium]
MPPETGPVVGLRERKKAKTRAAIQHEALRLFREQGYETTTIEQIAEAVEISPSTFFRYFRAKEDLVLTDDYDPLVIETIRAQPVELGPVQAVRGGLRVVFAGLTADELADMRARAELALAVPELRAAMLDQFSQITRQLTDLVAERLGRAADDVAVCTLAGAILGVMISMEFYWVDHRDSDLVALLDEALAHLESGFPL